MSSTEYRQHFEHILILNFSPYISKFIQSIAINLRRERSPLTGLIVIQNLVDLKFAFCCYRWTRSFGTDII